jgi:chitin disaccharide deacetylase
MAGAGREMLRARRGRRVSRWCICNADDFGATRGVNRGVIEAHLAGVLTSASLMVNVRGSADAADLAAGHPDLGVGLHVNLTNEGDPVVDVEDAEACRAEVDRQIATFHDLVGRPPTHLDVHHNLHRRPNLAPVFREAVRRLRIPLREHSPVRYFSAFYALWDDGETHPEHVSVDSLLAMVAAFGPGVTELSCHPGYVDDDLDSPYALQRELELATLLDPRLLEGLERLDVRLVSYRDLPRLLEDGVAI